MAAGDFEGRENVAGVLRQHDDLRDDPVIGRVSGVLGATADVGVHLAADVRAKVGEQVGFGGHPGSNLGV
ncbi:hypothetical protein GCM10027360_29750 [Amycolatopsis echigonensis]